MDGSIQRSRKREIRQLRCDPGSLTGPPRHKKCDDIKRTCTSYVYNSLDSLWLDDGLAEKNIIAHKLVDPSANVASQVDPSVRLPTYGLAILLHAPGIPCRGQSARYQDLQGLALTPSVTISHRSPGSL
jgi:hypothetical protein